MTTTEATTPYTVAETARMAKVSVKTIYREIRDGRITPKRIRRRTMILHEELVRYMRTDYSSPSSQPAGERNTDNVDSGTGAMP
jgi:excisionase family DNA binding protein